MDFIRLAENIAILRKKRKITQEQLAEFCGVTKASVSKWETRQSIPDIMLLPRLAGFFGITIDELIGYEVYLTKEQIHKIYENLSIAFATKEFSYVMEQCREYVKRYYSCYEFLEKIVLLWINHEMLAGERRKDMLEEAKALCEHILGNCRDISLCNDVVLLNAIIDLLLENAVAVIEALEDMNNPCRLSIQGEEVLLSAYIQAGMVEKGNDYAQVMMYFHLLFLVSDASKFLELNKENLEKCEETKLRIETLVKLYSLEEINFHVVSLFFYQMAVIYCQHGEKAKAIEQFKKYVELIKNFLQGQYSYLKGDQYLDRLDVWFEKSILDGNFQKEKKVVYDNLCSAFSAPDFEIIKDEEEFIFLQKNVKEMSL